MLIHKHKNSLIRTLNSLHKKSLHKKSLHKKSLHKKSLHKKSLHKKSLHKKFLHKKSLHKNSKTLKNYIGGSGSLQLQQPRLALFFDNELYNFTNNCIKDNTQSTPQNNSQKKLKLTDNIQTSSVLTVNIQIPSVINIKVDGKEGKDLLKNFADIITDITNLEFTDTNFSINNYINYTKFIPKNDPTYKRLITYDSTSGIKTKVLTELTQFIDRYNSITDMILDFDRTFTLIEGLYRANLYNNVNYILNGNLIPNQVVDTDIQCFINLIMGGVERRNSMRLFLLKCIEKNIKITILTNNPVVLEVPALIPELISLILAYNDEPCILNGIITIPDIITDINKFEIITTISIRDIVNKTSGDITKTQTQVSKYEIIKSKDLYETFLNNVSASQRVTDINNIKTTLTTSITSLSII